jgi:hypothetical protein
MMCSIAVPVDTGDICTRRSNLQCSALTVITLANITVFILLAVAVEVSGKPRTCLIFPLYLVVVFFENESFLIFLAFFVLLE